VGLALEHCRRFGWVVYGHEVGERDERP
jgi:hypothetical protein